MDVPERFYADEVREFARHLGDWTGESEVEVMRKLLRALHQELGLQCTHVSTD